MTSIAALPQPRTHPWAAAAFFWLALIGGAAALVDAAVRRLPNRLTLAAYAGVLAFLALQGIADGDPRPLVRALVCGLGLAAFFLVAGVSRGGVGMGDVKLSAAVGTALGWVGVPALVAGALAGLALAAVAALAAVGAGRLGWREALPFGPFLILGALVGLSIG